MAKREAKSASMLTRLRLEMAKLTVAKFPGSVFGMDGDILFFHGVMPLGWGGSPGHFYRFSDTLAICISCAAPQDMSGIFPFPSVPKCILMTVCSSN